MSAQLQAGSSKNIAGCCQWQTWSPQDFLTLWQQSWLPAACFSLDVLSSRLLSLKVSNESRLSIFPRLANDMSRSGPLFQHQRKSFQGNTVAIHWSKDKKVCLRGSSELGCAPLSKESLNYHSTGLVVRIRQLHIPTLGIGKQNNSKRPT